VHTELDWSGGLGFGDPATVSVTTAAIGTTSFTLAFDVARDGVSVCAARTVYVVVDVQGGGKRAIPAALRSALESALPAG
jgi:acyl-CoA thioester hydrolase